MLPRKLRILSYNIQVGVDTSRYREYVTKGWKHILPHRERMKNLNLIAAMLAEYDMVSLQEVDAGSLRSGFVDITEYLAHRAGFPHWYRQVNRNMGPLGRHSNGFLTHLQPSRISHHKLPGAPGRGVSLYEFGHGDERLILCNLHLALSRRARTKQLEFLSQLVDDSQHLIVMGDLNAGYEDKEISEFVGRHTLHEPVCEDPTFPSWRPVKQIDHIFVSKSLVVNSASVVNYPLSDHLPISLEFELPFGIEAVA